MKDNLLINETSLYLLQHAQNPVHWEPWSNRAFENATKKNKMVLVSIGYSACHWCHVMEHESFEDKEIADFMNKHFICIKVDREERPDVDHLYMKSIQLMGVNGGWPLNCFVLPDGRPIYGGTYFNKDEWLRILKALVLTYEKEKAKVLSFAHKLELELQKQNQQLTSGADFLYSNKSLLEIMRKWKTSFDQEDGGFSYVPKFPMPNSLMIILNYGAYVGNNSTLEFIYKTLDKISFGGMFDHVDGGFARYSTDAVWKVPHFEKMLYDNAQLIELYSEAYLKTNNSEFIDIVYKSYQWLKTDLKTKYGCYLCSQDADTDGVEGAFYCWTEVELKSTLKNEFEWFKEYFNISNTMVWEHNRYILFKENSASDFASAKGWPIDEFKEKLNNAMNLLRKERNLRNKPGIDTKSLSSWNALLIKAYAKAYVAFEDEVFLEEAKEIAEWIIEYQLNSEFYLKHNFVNGEAAIDGFLEDYSFTADAFILLYQVSGDYKWIAYAKKIIERVEIDFNSLEHDLYYFSNSKTTLISRKIEVEDDVMPSSNSVLAHCFYQLGVYFRRDDWTLKSKQMLSNVIESMEQYPMSYSNWFHLYFRLTLPNKELSIIQDDLGLNVDVLRELIHPLTTISYHSSLPMSDTFTAGIFVCENQTCLPKIKSTEELILKIKIKNKD